jgi:replicative DNA helicase
MSAEAEAKVLGGLMYDNTAFWRVADRLSDADFAFEGNRTLFRLIGDQLREGKPADAVTLGDLCPELLVYAVELQRNAYTSANVPAYADIVRQHGERRRLREAGDRIAQCADYEDALGILATVRPHQARAVKSVTDGLKEMVANLQRRYDADGKVSGVPTGWDSLDALTSGFQPGNLIIIAARPGMGKSAVALQAAIAAGRTFYGSLEMTAGELTERAAAHVGNFPHRWMRFPADAPDNPFDLARLSATTMDDEGKPFTEFGAMLHYVCQRVAKLPLLIDDTAGVTADAAFSRARQAHMVAPLKLAIFDHLGLFDRPGKHDPSELGLITAGGKRLAKELEIPVVILCQLNRGLEQRPNKRPQLSDLRDSGRIEEDADVVIGLYRDEYYHPDPSNPLAGYAEATVLKNRSGELGTAWARSRLSCMRLESCDAPERPAVGPANTHATAGFQARGAGSRKPQAVS